MTRLPFGYHIVKGATGNLVGRPRKPFAELGRWGQIKRAQRELHALLANPEVPADIDCSGPEDWARERKEREEAVERWTNSPTFRERGNRG